MLYKNVCQRLGVGGTFSGIIVPITQEKDNKQTSINIYYSCTMLVGQEELSQKGGHEVSTKYCLLRKPFRHRTPCPHCTFIFNRKKNTTTKHNIYTKKFH